MKKSRFSEHQIIKIPKEVEAERIVEDACREYIISSATYIMPGKINLAVWKPRILAGCVTLNT